MLPAVRYLTVTLSSRELRRFRLVLLLISNECSSLVAATPTATNLRVCASASFAFLYLSQSIHSFFSSFSPLSLFLSLSFTLAAHRAHSYLSTFDNRDRRRGETARSLTRSNRALAHPHFPIRRYRCSRETSPVARSNVRRCTMSTGDFLVFPVHTNARSRTAHPGRMHGRRIPIRQ